MINKLNQMLVGPTVLPQRVMNAMAKPAISHRSKEYEQVQHNVMEGIKKVFKTSQDVLVYTASGTGALEATIMNLFEEGDEILIPTNGEFSKLIAKVSIPYNLKVKTVDFDYGETCNVDEILAHITPDTKAIFLVHNESSTGVINDIKKLGLALKDSDILVIVDSVSGAGGIDIEMDNWGLDVVITASQKALMAPPGMSFISLSDRAWEVAKKVDNKKYYFNFLKDRDYGHRNLTVHTPATHTLLALEESLKMLEEEGIDEAIKRHKQNSTRLIQGLEALDLKILAKDIKYASPTLTCVHVPGKAKYYVGELRKRGYEVGGGKSPLGEDTFRIGTMGYITKADIEGVLCALADIETHKR